MKRNWIDTNTWPWWVWVIIMVGWISWFMMLGCAFSGKCLIYN